MPPQQITLAGDVFRICLKPVYITRGEPQDASLGKLKTTHNPPLLYPQILPRSSPDPVQILSRSSPHLPKSQILYRSPPDPLEILTQSSRYPLQILVRWAYLPRLVACSRLLHVHARRPFVALARRVYLPFIICAPGNPKAMKTLGKS